MQRGARLYEERLRSVGHKRSNFLSPSKALSRVVANTYCRRVQFLFRLHDCGSCGIAPQTLFLPLLLPPPPPPLLPSSCLQAVEWCVAQLNEASLCDKRPVSTGRGGDRGALDVLTAFSKCTSCVDLLRAHESA